MCAGGQERRGSSNPYSKLRERNKRETGENDQQSRHYYYKIIHTRGVARSDHPGPLHGAGPAQASLHHQAAHEDQLETPGQGCLPGGAGHTCPRNVYCTRVLSVTRIWTRMSSSRARGRTTGFRAGCRGPSCSITRTKAKVASKDQAKASTRPSTTQAKARCLAPTLDTSTHRARARHQRCCLSVR